MVSTHREENVSNEINFKNLLESLNQLALRFNYPIIVSTHPRTQKMIDSKQIVMEQEVQFLKPMANHVK